LNASSAACRFSTISAAITIGSWQTVHIFQTVVLEPEDVEVKLVALEEESQCLHKLVSTYAG